MPGDKVNSIHLPSPADEIVRAFVDKLRSIQPGFIEGIYLTGSLPLHDFYSSKSDIDFLVLCSKLPDEKMAFRLKKIHRAIERQFRQPNLSGCYLTIDNIQTSDPENSKVLSYHERSIRFQSFEMAPVNLTELKENAYTVYGVNATTLPVNTSRKNLNDFLYQNINSYWTGWIKRHSSTFNRKIVLFVFPRFTEWAVLGLARQLYTLHTGKITSKSAAGYYCLGHFPEKFHQVIKEAIEIRKDDRTYPFVKSYAVRPSFRRLRQTIDCTKYLIDIFNKAYHEELSDKAGFSNITSNGKFGS